jgi:hypothetical protein
MKPMAILICVMFVIMPFQAEAERGVDFPEVPRISAYQAYLKYKAGEAILIQAGGERYEGRHIMGAVNMVSAERVVRGEIKLPNFPRKGIEIYTYCY